MQSVRRKQIISFDRARFFDDRAIKSVTIIRWEAFPAFGTPFSAFPTFLAPFSLLA